MRVAGARVSRHRLSYRSPVLTARGRITHRSVVVLSLFDEEGNAGLGEAAPLVGFTGDTVDDAEAALLAWVEEGYESALEASPTARAAVDWALVDLAASAAGVPLHDYLSPGSPSRLAVSALVVGETPGALAAAAAEAAEAGHPGVKLKVGAGPFADDVDRVSAVRNAVGPDVAIRLDANGAWEPSEALSNIERLAPLGIEFVEEPVSGVAALAAVREASPVPVAADESAGSPDLFEQVLASGAADLVVLKPSALGGPQVAADLATRATAAGMGVVVTSMLESSIGVGAAAHLASALGALDPAPGLATAGLLAEDLVAPLLPVGGHLDLDA